jgi:hypothetical protein
MAAINNVNVVYSNLMGETIVVDASHVHEYNNGSPQTINLTSDSVVFWPD